MNHAQLHRHIWQELTSATHDREHEWRRPVLATLGLDRQPNARTVVLRQALEDSGKLVFFTDRRSPKVSELQEWPQGMLVFWSTQLRWQLRVAAQFRVITSGHEVDAAWSRMAASATADYLSANTPGQPLAGSGRTTAELRDDHQLAVVVAGIKSMDWLALGLDGRHQRILFADGTAQPLSP